LISNSLPTVSLSLAVISCLNSSSVVEVSFIYPMVLLLTTTARAFFLNTKEPKRQITKIAINRVIIGLPLNLKLDGVL